MTEVKALNDGNQCNHRHGHGRHGHRGGSSSFWIHDPEVVFNALSLKEGDCFLDMGCGPGDYVIQASKTVGDSGVVYALDKWQHLLDGLTEKADSQGLRNIKAIACDITGPLPIEDGCVDVCLLSTVLHIFNLSEVGKTIFNEIKRVLKPGGRVAIIECKKENQPFGPPKHMRLSPQDVEASITKYGFEKVGLADLGYNYMIQFEVG
jgi:ubiquinone/menaquinone biosynthesis C-methylase UbiE